MNISFKKNLNKNYMVIEKRDNFSENCFAAQMLGCNKVNNLLVFGYETINDKTNFLYDVSSKQAFSRQFDTNKMTFENLRDLCLNLKSLIDALEEYLLEPNDIVMKKECIFTTPEAKEYEFCFCPGYNGDIIFELSELFNYVLQVINYEDEKAVRLAYKIHQKVQTEYFTINDIMDALNENSNLLPIKIETIDDNLVEIEEGEIEAYIDEDSEKGFFEKVALYLKGRSFIDVLDDINNKEFMYKVNEYGRGVNQMLLPQSLMEESNYQKLNEDVSYGSKKSMDVLDGIEFIALKK